MNTLSPLLLVLVVLGSLTMLLAAPAKGQGPSPARVVAGPPAEARSDLYVFNREPLAPSPFARLPIGAIVPKGWLGHMLVLEAQGMSGHLEEISRWCKFEGSAWSSPEGKGQLFWEELPYWLRGYGDLGYVLKDEKIIANARRWLEGSFAGQMADGWFGPREMRTSLKGKPDVWPNMLILNAMQSLQEATGDPRVIPLMTRYFRWELDCPEEDFLSESWQKVRAGDNLESVYWLYNRTGEKWLLDLAAKIHRRAANWTGGVASWHGVNFCQCFREPAEYWMQAGDPKFLQAAERNYQSAMDQYGQVPGGMFGADENARQGYGDPRQGAETCSIIEFMHSFEMLTRITGNPLWADRCEEVAFNSFPASMTPDQKALHYITSPNVVQLDRGNKAPGLQNGGDLLSYSPGEQYRCCQHNVSMGWPYYAEELWLATADGGLCASLYAACEVKAKVAGGAEVTVAEQTDYPFSPTVTLKLSTAKGAKFPLYLRVPRWCEGAKVAVNGQAVDVKSEPLKFIVLDRPWADGDTVVLELPMKLSVRTWAKNKGSVSVDYGPLTFALKIGERWARYAGKEGWPQSEVFPTTAWNYGLVLDEKNPTGAFDLKRKPGPLPDQPFTPEAAPIELTAKARKIPNWQADKQELVGLLQPSPARTGEPVETVTLIPMGAARLRISQFPTAVAEGGNEWSAPATQPK